MILSYVFDSDYADDEAYEIYDGEDFDYEVDEEDIKDWYIWDYKKRLDLDLCNISELKDLLDEMDHNGEFSWDKALKKTYDEIKDYYKTEAMEWFIENNYIMTEDDYKSHLADMYNDDKWLREHEKD